MCYRHCEMNFIKVCPTCGAENEACATFCEACWDDLPEVELPDIEGIEIPAVDAGGAS